MEDKIVTLSFLKKYDELKAPPIQYVDELPHTNVENGIYAITHSETDVKVVEARFTDILSTYFTEATKGKWTVNSTYSLSIDDKHFASAFVSLNSVSIYKNADWTEMYSDSYSVNETYSFTISEDIEHIDYYAGSKSTGDFVKLANEAEVEKYFVRIEEKGKPNGVASLDVNGKVPVEQLPTESLIYRGSWDPNSGAYPQDGEIVGEFYIVSAEGDFDNIHWNINDWLIWDGSKWNKSENHNDVTSVNGKKGVVTVYGDNTEIETPSETEVTDTRTIKQYIDDITVDGVTWTEDTQDIISKAVIEVGELPTEVKDKVYYITTDKQVFAKDIRLAVDDTVVKTINKIEPDEDGNIENWAVIEDEQLPDEPENKVYNITKDDVTKVYSKSEELVTKDFWDKNRAVQNKTTEGEDFVYIEKNAGVEWFATYTDNRYILSCITDQMLKSDFESMTVTVNGFTYDLSTIPSEVEDGDTYKFYNITMGGEPFGPNAAGFVYYANTKQAFMYIVIEDPEGKINELSLNKYTPFYNNVNDNIEITSGETAIVPNTICPKAIAKSGDYEFPLDQNFASEQFEYNAVTRKITNNMDTSREFVFRYPKSYVFTAGDKVWAKDVELATIENLNNKYNELKDDVNITVNSVGPDANRNIDITVELTKAEYAKLVEKDADNPNVMYAVTDEASSVDIMNDFVIAENLTWSSSKINSVIQAATPNIIIDNKKETTSVWSSKKVSDELDKKAVIDDDNIVNDKTWSSNKINSEISAEDTSIKQFLIDNYEPKNADLLTKTNADTYYEPKNADLLTKTEAANTYQLKGNYVTTDSISDMATKTWVGNEGFLKSNAISDMLTKTEAASTYSTKNDISDMLTKTDASNTYQPIGSYATSSDISDMATKTWVGNNFVTTSQIYVSGGTLYINM